MREGSFEVSAAACAEQHVAAKQDAGCDVGEVVVQVAGGFDDVEHDTEGLKLELAAFAQVMGDVRIAGMSPPIHRHVVYFAQCCDAAGVVGMAVGAQDRLELQAVCIQECQYRLGFAGIDHGGMAVVVDDPDVVVLQGRDGGDFKCWGGNH